MSLKVLGDRVLIKPKALEKKIGMIEISYGDNENAHKMATQEGEIVGIGEHAWREYPNAWAKIGDKVVFAQYSGKFIEDPETKEKYIVINDIDVQVIVKED